MTSFHIVSHFISDSFFFFFNDTATTEIYTLSLHDALPICHRPPSAHRRGRERDRLPDRERAEQHGHGPAQLPDRKSTRLNSSHSQISYAVFCLKKKKYNYYHIFQCQTNHSAQR